MAGIKLSWHALIGRFGLFKVLRSSFISPISSAISSHTLLELTVNPGSFFHGDLEALYPVETLAQGQRLDEPWH